MLQAQSHGHGVAASTPSLLRSPPSQGRGWGEATGGVRQGLAAEGGRPRGAGGKGTRRVGGERVCWWGGSREAQGGPQLPDTGSKPHSPAALRAGPRGCRPSRNPWLQVDRPEAQASCGLAGPAFLQHVLPATDSVSMGPVCSNTGNPPVSGPRSAPAQELFPPTSHSKSTSPSALSQPRPPDPILPGTGPRGGRLPHGLPRSHGAMGRASPGARHCTGTATTQSQGRGWTFRAGTRRTVLSPILGAGKMGRRPWCLPQAGV